MVEAWQSDIDVDILYRDQWYSGRLIEIEYKKNGDPNKMKIEFDGRTKALVPIKIGDGVFRGGKAEDPIEIYFTE